MWILETSSYKANAAHLYMRLASDCQGPRNGSPMPCAEVATSHDKERSLQVDLLADVIGRGFATPQSGNSCYFETSLATGEHLPCMTLSI